MRHPELDANDDNRRKCGAKVLEDNLYLGKFSSLIRHRFMPSGRKLSSMFQILSSGFVLVGFFWFIWLAGWGFLFLFFLFAILCNNLSLLLLGYHM